MTLRAIAVLALLAVSGAAVWSHEPATGIWVGRCRIERDDIFLFLRLQPGAALVQCPALGVQESVSVTQNDGEHLALSFQTPRGAVRLACTNRGDEMVGTAECAESAGACTLRPRREMDAAAWGLVRGNYRLGERIILIGGFEGTGYRFLSDGDLRTRLTPVGPHEFLSDDLRTVRFELDKQGAADAASSAGRARRPRGRCASSCTRKSR